MIEKISRKRKALIVRVSAEKEQQIRFIADAYNVSISDVIGHLILNNAQLQIELKRAEEKNKNESKEESK
jgi:hypothetical protein